MNKKMLIIHSKSICYESTDYFVKQALASFKQNGWDVEVCDMVKQEEAVWQQQLENAKSQDYNAILEFNGVMANAVEEDGKPYLDHIDAPYYNYILDHPLFHHEMLNKKLKRYHVICVDQEHVTYIQTYYPHIKEVIFLPIGGFMQLMDKTEKEDAIVFTGTYTSPRAIEHMMERCHPMLLKEMNAVLDIMRQDMSLSQEDALKLLMNKLGVSLSNEQFAAMMHRHFLINTYMQAYVREQVVKTMVSSGIKLHVYGHGWEKYRDEGKENLILHGEVSFEESLEVLSRAKFVLNVMPLFHAGCHDRVLTAMNNGAIVITDRTKFLEQVLIDQKNILMYDFGDRKMLPDMIQKIREPQIVHRMAEEAKVAIKGRLDWQTQMKQLMSRIDTVQH